MASILGILPRIVSSHQKPPTAKNSAPLAISLLNADAPSRLSELNARSGEPRWMIDARKPIPITSQIKNMPRTRRSRASELLFSESQPSPLTIIAPATLCPSTVNSTSGHSCHPFPTLHLLRVGQIAGGITRRTAVGVRFNHNARLREVRGR